VSERDANGLATASSDREESPPAADRSLASRLRRFVRAVREGDEAMVEEMVLRLSRSHRMLTPLALVVGGFAMLFTGLKLLLSNWRLTLVQILPAMWIWFAMYDLKAHALHGKSLNVLRGPILIPIVLAIVAITAAGFFLNAVFGFAIVQSASPKIRPAFERARSHLKLILGWGTAVGLLLGLSTTVVSHPGFDGDFNARVCLAGGEVSDHAKSEEVPRGVAGARHAAGARVRTPDRACWARPGRRA
jgi:hypothetical protein